MSVYISDTYQEEPERRIILFNNERVEKGISNTINYFLHAIDLLKKAGRSFEAIEIILGSGRILNLPYDAHTYLLFLDKCDRELYLADFSGIPSIGRDLSANIGYIAGNSAEILELGDRNALTTHKVKIIDKTNYVNKKDIAQYIALETIIDAEADR